MNIQAENKVKKENAALEVWKRFRRNWVAMIGLFLVLFVALLAIFAGVIRPADPNFPGVPAYNMQGWFFGIPERSFPTAEFPFGTDNLGRCIFTRVIYGARISLIVGFVAVGIAAVIGIPLGAIAGFYGGVGDNIIMRLMDIILAMPTILLAIAIAAALGPGMMNVMLAVGIAWVPIYARTVRALVLTVKEQEFVEASRSCGAGDGRLIRKHILPNCAAPLIVEATMGIAGAILMAAALSFIGIGIQSPTPEWGAMLAEGRGQMLAGYWFTTVFPGLFIATMIISLNMIGDGLRDAFDPKLRGANFSKGRFRKIIRLRTKENAILAETALADGSAVKEAQDV